MNSVTLENVVSRVQSKAGSSEERQVHQCKPYIQTMVFIISANLFQI